MHEDVITVPLSQGMNTVIDCNDAELVLAHKWCAFCTEHTCYAQTSIDGTTVYLHRFILNAPPDLQVDHRDNDGLNNRRSNIRLATSSQNLANCRLRKDSISGYKGVQSRTPTTWRVRIRHKGKMIFLGTFESPIDAALAYDEAARSLYGEFARTNFPPMARSPIPKPKPTGKEIPINCVVCGVEFHIYPYEVGSRLYCSKRCKYDAQIGKRLSRGE